MISGTRKASDTTVTTTGCRRTTPDQRNHMPCPGFGVGLMNAGSDAQAIRCLSSPSSAGSSVIEPTTAATTPMAEARPSALTSGMPATPSESSAITTVQPAKTIALPAVETALAMESCIDIPARSCS